MNESSKFFNDKMQLSPFYNVSYLIKLRRF